MSNVDPMERFEELLKKYPKLPLILQAGVVSMKMCRTMLDLDKWLMEDLYQELVLCQAVRGVSNSTFRATQEALIYIKEREQFENV